MLHALSNFTKKSKVEFKSDTMQTKSALSFLFLLICGYAISQDSTSVKNRFTELPGTVKYVDTDGDGIISLYEAKIVFDQYRNNQDKKLQNDLIDEVESTVIELITYLEGVDCNDIKKSIASKRFIEVYYKNKFFDGIAKTPVAEIKAAETEAKTANSNEFNFDFPEDIVTDRPDQTEAPAITPPGFFQVEIGAQSESDNDKENNIKTTSTLYNTTLWKYGVTDRFEFRLITEYANDKATYKSSFDLKDTNITVSGFNPVAVGSKIHLQKAKGIIPEISLITHLELPYFGSDNYKPQFVIPRFRFLFAHSLSDRFNFSYNLGAEWEDGTSETTFIYTASLGASLFGNLSMFVESYGFVRETGEADHRLDGGFTYLLGHNVQLDMSGGIGLSKISPDYFVSCGVSFRFNAFNKEYRKYRMNQKRIKH